MEHLHSDTLDPLRPPTAFLPPLARLREQSLAQITDALQSLRKLYWPSTPAQLPPKFSSSHRGQQHVTDGVPDSGYASAEEDEDGPTQMLPAEPDDDEDAAALELLRADPFERAFAIKWLTGFISRTDAWAADVDTAEGERWLQAVDDVTALLSAFAGEDDEADGAVTRAFAFARAAGGGTVDVELNDAPLSTTDHTSVGLQSWASSILLAERLCAAPAQFGLAGSGRRVLELGAGTGLLSIVAAKLLGRGSPRSSVVATDYHPDVLANLRSNVSANFSDATAAVHVQTLDWACPAYVAPFDAPFDVILAADVVYHPEHARWIKECVERLLVRPGVGEASGLFWLIMPLRSTGRHEGMDKTVEEVFPDASLMKGGLALGVLAREESGRQGSVGRADEGGYKLFKIGWVHGQ